MYNNPSEVCRDLLLTATFCVRSGEGGLEEKRNGATVGRERVIPEDPRPLNYSLLEGGNLTPAGTPPR